MRFNSSTESLQAWIADIEGDIAKTRHAVTEIMRETHRDSVGMRDMILKELSLREAELTATPA